MRTSSDGTDGIQTASRADGGSTGLYYDWAGLVHAFMPNVESPRVAMLGLGGGEMLRVLKKTKPHAVLEAVEIDDRVISLALEKFPANVRDVKLVNMDALKWAKKCAGETPKYDAVIVDIYVGAELPLEFTQAQFFNDIEKCLLPRGMVIMNVAYRSFAKPTAEQLHVAGFGDVVAFPVTGQTNIILWAVRKDDWGEVRAPRELQAGFERRYTL